MQYMCLNRLNCIEEFYTIIELTQLRGHTTSFTTRGMLPSVL